MRMFNVKTRRMFVANVVTQRNGSKQTDRAGDALDSASGILRGEGEGGGRRECVGEMLKQAF
jgi:hypothetical protein